MSKSYAAHDAHGRWSWSAPCVYCACGARLYNGKLPRTAKEQTETAIAMDDLMAAIARLSHVEKRRPPMPDRYSITRSLVIWASLLTWPVLYIAGGWTAIAQAVLVFAAVGFLGWCLLDEWRATPGQPQWRDEE